MRSFQKRTSLLNMLSENYCPECQHTVMFLQGPSGGGTDMIKCSDCGQQYAWCPGFFAEKIPSNIQENLKKGETMATTASHTPWEAEDPEEGEGDEEEVPEKILITLIPARPGWFAFFEDEENHESPFWGESIEAWGGYSVEYEGEYHSKNEALIVDEDSGELTGDFVEAENFLGVIFSAELYGVLELKMSSVGNEHIQKIPWLYKRLLEKHKERFHETEGVETVPAETMLVEQPTSVEVTPEVSWAPPTVESS